MGDGETREEVPMNVMIHQQAEREAQRVQANREELVERIGRAIREDGTVQSLQGLHLSRCSLPLKPVHSVLEPSLCVIAQGSKEVLLGDSRYRYDPSQYLLATVEMPRVSQVLEASKERPYLSLRLELAPTLVGSVMVEAGHPSPPGHAEVRAIDVSPLDVNLLDAVVRLVRLLDSPSEAPVLMPLITRELSTGSWWESRVAGSVTLRSWGATPPTSPERSSDCVKTSTSHFASRISRESWE